MNINYNINNDTLYIYDDDRILATVSDCMNKSDEYIEWLIDDVLFNMGVKN